VCLTIAAFLLLLPIAGAQQEEDLPIRKLFQTGKKQ
jgi:hypothetical protein